MARSATHVDPASDHPVPDRSEADLPGPGLAVTDLAVTDLAEPDLLSVVPGPDESVRWLDEEEQQTWRGWLASSRLLLQRVEQNMQQDSGMAFTYYEMLVRLSEAPGRRLRMSALAETSLSSRSRTSHAAARLEAQGWITREAVDTDGRGFEAVLTPCGLAALRSAAPAHVETVRDSLVGRLTPEQAQQLREISGILLEHLTATGSVSPVPLR